MQATITSSNNLPARLAKVGTGLCQWAVALGYFIILFLGWDLLVWAATCGWAQNIDSAPWRDGGWWAWRNGITSPTLHLLLTCASFFGFLDAAELTIRHDSIKELLTELAYLFFFVLALSAGIGFIAFVLSLVFQFGDWAIALLGVGWLF